MRKEPYPGAKCKVIGSSVGPSGSTVGRIVRVVDRADPPTHVVWGDMWDCESVDGQPMATKITTPDMQNSTIQHGRMNATFASDWLLVVEDDDIAPKSEVKEIEIIN